MHVASLNFLIISAIISALFQNIENKSDNQKLSIF